MRAETQKRLIDLLQGEIAKLQTKIDAKNLEEYLRLDGELRKYAQTEYWKVLKTEKAINQATAELAKIQLQRDKSWRAYNSQMKNMSAWYDEQYLLERDLADLKRSFAYPIH